jgi:predicted ArsR family transcriptional regulator
MHVKNGSEQALKVEDVFYSKTRMKILKVLTQLGQLNVSDIARRVGANYETAKQHLSSLETEGILQQRTFGRAKLYRFNQASPKAAAVQNLVETWNH